MNKDDHQKITRNAIDAYLNHFCSERFKPVLEKYCYTIVRATETEDVWYRNWHRPFHWHFYKQKANTNPDFFHYLGSKMTVYSHHVYNDYVRDFNDSLAALASYDRTALLGNFSCKLALKRLFECVGGILHHIQDMSTPAHVVPVFHGKPAPGEFMAIDDQFEAFSGGNIEKYLEKSISQEDLEKVVANALPSDSFQKIYETAAEKTLDFLRTATFVATVDETTRTDVPCTMFWREYDYEMDPLRGHETAGFGEYGPLAGCFGKENPQEKDDGRVIDAGCDCTVDGQHWNIKFEQYSHLYLESLRQMVCNSLWCLHVVDGLYAKHNV